MDALLLRLSTDLPGVAGFLFAVGGGLLALAGVGFALRKTAFGRWFSSSGDRALGGLVAALLLGMVFLSALQILLRNFFDSGLLWIDPMLRHLVLLLTFTGALLATSAKRHVQINVLGRLISGRLARSVGAAVALLAGSLCVLLGRAGLELLADEIEFGDVVFLGIPAWVVVFVFPLSFLAMALRFYGLVYSEFAGEAPASAEELEAAAEAGEADGPAGEAST